MLTVDTFPMFPIIVNFAKCARHLLHYKVLYHGVRWRKVRPAGTGIPPLHPRCIQIPLKQTIVITSILHSCSDVAMDGNKHEDTVGKPSLRIRALWEACGMAATWRWFLSHRVRYLWVGLEDGILRLGCGRDAGLRNLLKVEDGGWCSPVNAAFGVLGEPSDGANGTPRLRCGPVYIVRGGRVDGLGEILEVPQVQYDKDYGGLTQRYNFRTRCAAVYKGIAKIMTDLQCVVMPAKVSAILPKSCDRHNINQDFPEFPDGALRANLGPGLPGLAGLAFLKPEPWALQSPVSGSARLGLRAWAEPSTSLIAERGGQFCAGLWRH
ncbi:hypothetical protein B0H13DRAFT_1918093 [Mycena leptocephala]|nr:hypothetical protein B0H13DRAFT_1918093 [Mycena leptocephala]